jgi:branched-chain amino acid transport system ATP-binding protein
VSAGVEGAGAARSDGTAGTGPDTLLELSGINTFYGAVHILEDVDLVVGKGELVCLLGGNACGKSTTLKTALGLVSPRTGTVTFDGVDVTSRPTSERVARGMAVVPENRRLFAPMTVLENLQIGAWVRGAPDPADLDRVFELFPLLEQRSAQIAGTLSGGEQQMVAMGRALMSRPSLMLMDEPSMGLSPRLVEQSFELIEALHRDGVSMLIVEQNANMALSIADRGYVLQTGRIVLRGSAQELSNHDELRRAYLGR